MRLRHGFSTARPAGTLPGLLRAAAIAFCLAGLAPVLAGCGDDGAAADGGGQMPPMPVATITAEPAAVPVVAELPGRIAPTRIAEVRPRVSGILVERVFRQGAIVAEGDVLYRIDPQPFRVQVDRARATLARAEAVRTQASQLARRQAELRERKVASAQAFDDAVASLAQADADVAAARAGLAAAELDLRYSEVRAPITGRIGRARVTEGALVSSADAEALATIQQLDPVYADFTQSAGEMLALRRQARSGTLALAEEEGIPVTLLFDDGTAYPHTGRLLFSEAMVDATTGQVVLRGAFPNPDGELLPGMYVRVRLTQGVQPDALAVPVQAVRRDAGGKPQLYLVDAQGQVEVRPVVAGREEGGRQVIASGLKAGEQVIVEGFQKIRPGAPVSVAPWQAPTPTSDNDSAAPPAPAAGAPAPDAAPAANGAVNDTTTPATGD